MCLNVSKRRFFIFVSMFFVLTPVLRASQASSVSMGSTSTSQESSSQASSSHTHTYSSSSHAVCMCGSTMSKNAQGVEAWDKTNCSQSSAKLSAEELYELALKHKTGNGAPKDDNVAFSLFESAASQNYAPAQFELGICYELGIGITIDLVKAFDLFKRAAAQGFAQSQNSLGLCYEYSKGVTADLTQAVEWYEAAAKQGFAEAQFNLGLCYENGIGIAVDPSKAVEWYLEAAKHGHAKARCNIGFCYGNGKGLAVNENKAFEWYEMAAKQGSIIAQYNLGIYYKKGLGMAAANPKKAAELFLQAANQGDRDAQYQLALCYEQGTGVEENPEKAYEFYQLAANQGHEAASKKVAAASEAVRNYAFLTAREKYELGEAHGTGINAAKDLKLAAQFYELAANDGYAAAAYKLGCCYEDGKGVQIDSYQALELYKYAAKKNYAQAQNKLGDFHRVGKAMWFSHPDQAVDWYTKAANQGDKDALYNLGCCYEYGVGVTTNTAKAFVYYQRAARHGNQDAQSKEASATEEMKQYTNLTAQEMFEFVDALDTGKNNINELQLISILYQALIKRGNTLALKRLEALNAKNNVAKTRSREMIGGTQSSFHSSQQEAKEAKEKANQEASANPFSLAYAETLAQELRASVLEDCPSRIRTLIGLWGQYSVAWKRKDEQMCKSLNDVLPKKLLLVGPSGTGKSTMSKAIAEECEMPFFRYFAASFSNQYGSSGMQNLERVFTEAASLQEPCVIIIDELPALYQPYANRNDANMDMLIQFCVLLDRYKDSPLLVIATLNDLSELPQQVVDRFYIDAVEIPLPDELKRVKLLSYYMEHLCGASSEALAQEFAALTDTYSNQALKDLVSLAQSQHLMRHERTRLPSRKDFFQALEYLKCLKR